MIINDLLDNPKIIIKNYKTNAVLIKIKRKNFDTNIIMRKNQCNKNQNRNNKSIWWKRRPHLSIPRRISIPRCLSSIVYLEKSSSCFTRIHVTLFSLREKLNFHLATDESIWMFQWERKKERGFCTNSQFAFYIDVTDVQAMKRKDLPASFNRGTDMEFNARCKRMGAIVN